MSGQSNTAGATQPGPNDIEGRETAQRQAPGYNETSRGDDDPSGEINQAEPSRRTGDEPASVPVNSGMQGEGEPGRAQRDSTGGVEGSPGGNDT